MPRRTVGSLASTRKKALPNLHVRERSALMQEAEQRGQLDAAHAFPDEDIGETYPPGARRLVACGQADVATVQRYGEDQLRHDRQAMHRRRVQRNQQQERTNRLVERLYGKEGTADEEEQRAGQSNPNRRHESRLHLGGLTIGVVVIVVMVGEAIINKFVFDLLGASSTETWLFTAAVGTGVMWAAHRLGSERSTEADAAADHAAIKSGIVPVLLLSLAGCIVTLGVLRGVAFHNDQAIINKANKVSFALGVAPAAVMFGFIQLLFNGVAYAVGYRRHEPSVQSAKQARSSRWWAGVRRSLARSRLTRRQWQDEQAEVLLAAHCREFVAWARDILESYAAAVEVYYDAITAAPEPQRAAVLADQARPALKEPAWLQEYESAATKAEPELDEVAKAWKPPIKSLGSVPPPGSANEEEAA